MQVAYPACLFYHIRLLGTNYFVDIFDMVDVRFDQQVGSTLKHSSGVLTYM